MGIRSRAAVLGVVAAVGLAACDEARPPLLARQVTGVATLGGPVAGAAVTLRTWPGGGLPGEVLAEGVTDPAGAFALSTAYEGRALRVEVVAPGSPVPLVAVAGDFPYGENVAVRVGPFSTWVAAVRAEPPAGATSALDIGASAAAGHLGFDPVRPAEAGDETPALLEAAFAALPARLSRLVGAPPEALGPGAVLGALVTDAQSLPMDGLGADGALALTVGGVPLPVTGDWLRGHLADAVLDVVGAPPFSHLSPRDVRPLLDRLRCGDAVSIIVGLFAPCAGPPPGDASPPVITLEAPAGAASAAESGDALTVTGRVELRARAVDGESGVASFVVEGPGGGALDDADAAPDVFSGAWDTRNGPPGEHALTFIATNHDGGVARGTLRLRPDNLPGGVVRGWVFKGPARGVTVTAHAVEADGSAGAALGEGRTDAEARFEIALDEHAGPVLLRARGRADGTAQYLDEAVAGRWLTWDADETLEGLVPEFSPGAPGFEVVVSPLTDLAVARGRALAAVGAPFAGATVESAALLGAHFDVPDPLGTRPSLPDAPAHEPPTAGDRYMLALACLSRQALDLAPRLNPAAPAAFTPLALVGLYRADLAADGVLDGRAGAEPTGLPPEAFRVELARACARWLGDAANTTGLTSAAVADVLDARISRDVSALFDPDHVPEAFDAAGPAIDAPVLTSVEGHAGPEGLRGPVLVTIDAADPAGVAALALAISPEAPGALTLFDGGQIAHRVYLFDTTLVADAATPPRAVRLIARAVDALGNPAERETDVFVDNRPPGLTLRADGAVVGGADAAVLSTARSPTRLTVATDEPARVVVTVDGAEAHRGEAAPGRPAEVDLLWRREGPATVVVEAVDAVGNVAAPASVTVLFDATPPTLAVRPTDFVDERRLTDWPLPADLRAAGLPRQVLDEAAFAEPAAVVVARQVHRWARDAAPDNPVDLHLAVADAWTPSEALSATWRRAPGACFLLDDAIAPSRPSLTAAAPVPVPDGGGGAERLLPLDAETLGFDPLDPLGPARVPVCLEVTLADAAGNAVARTFDVEALRVAPVVEWGAVDSRAIRAPRLADVDAVTSTRLLSAGDEAIGVAAWQFRNPYADLAVAVELRLPDPAVEAAARGVEVWSMPHFVGFDPPACAAAFDARLEVPATWPFLRGNAGAWVCEPMIDLPATWRVPGSLALAFDAGPYGENLVFELRRGADVGRVLTVGLRPGPTPAPLAALLDPAGLPALEDRPHAAVVQGPGRTAGPTLDCAAPPCAAWYELTRGRQLTGVATDLGGERWAVVLKYGRFVELVLPTAGPGDFDIELGP
jgi:hypothetical protein